MAHDGTTKGRRSPSTTTDPGKNLSTPTGDHTETTNGPAPSPRDRAIRRHQAGLLAVPPVSGLIDEVTNAAPDTITRFRPTIFPRSRATEELNRVAQAPGASAKNRISVLLANAEEEQTLTITHTLWAMFGLLPNDQVQKPHLWVPKTSSVGCDLPSRPHRGPQNRAGQDRPPCSCDCPTSPSPAWSRFCGYCR